MLKNLLSIHKPHAPHMVGDGLPVCNFFSYADELGKGKLSPFLMLDYGIATDFPPTTAKLGVGMHPHRGFETVTLVFSGGLSHRDTAGNEGTISQGDVQWMTAGSGVLHEELHSEDFRKTGGRLQMIQLWVNLPAEHKMTQPKYQTLDRANIPLVNLTTDEQVVARVISGRLHEQTGPARTFTPVGLWDVEFKKAGAKVSLPFQEGHTAAILCMEGTVRVNAQHLLHAQTLALFERSGTEVSLESDNFAKILVLSGEPIPEPVVGYGPFVMNSKEQIVQALDDFQNGRFGAVTG